MDDISQKGIIFVTYFPIRATHALNSKSNHERVGGNIFLKLRPYSHFLAIKDTIVEQERQVRESAYKPLLQTEIENNDGLLG